MHFKPQHLIRKIIREEISNLFKTIPNKEIVNEKWYHNLAAGAALIGSTLAGGDIQAQNTQNSTGNDVEYYKDTFKNANWEHLKSILPQSTYSKVDIGKYAGTNNNSGNMFWGKNSQNLDIETLKDSSGINVIFRLNDKNTNPENLIKIMKIFDENGIRNTKLEPNNSEGDLTEAGATISFKDVDAAANIILQVLNIMDIK